MNKSLLVNSASGLIARADYTKTNIPALDAQTILNDPSGTLSGALTQGMVINYINGQSMVEDGMGNMTNTLGVMVPVPNGGMRLALQKILSVSAYDSSITTGNHPKGQQFISYADKSVGWQFSWETLDIALFQTEEEIVNWATRLIAGTMESIYDGYKLIIDFTIIQSYINRATTDACVINFTQADLDYSDINKGRKIVYYITRVIASLQRKWDKFFLGVNKSRLFAVVGTEMYNLLNAVSNYVNGSESAYEASRTLIPKFRDVPGILRENTYISLAFGTNIAKDQSFNNINAYAWTKHLLLIGIKGLTSYAYTVPLASTLPAFNNGNPYHTTKCRIGTEVAIPLTNLFCLFNVEATASTEQEINTVITKLSSSAPITPASIADVVKVHKNNRTVVNDILQSESGDVKQVLELDRNETKVVNQIA